MSPLYVIYYLSGDSEVGSAVPAWIVLNGSMES